MKKFLEKLDHLDPTPWHQAFLLGIGLGIMIFMALFGNYVDELHPSTRTQIEIIK